MGLTLWNPSRLVTDSMIAFFGARLHHLLELDASLSFPCLSQRMGPTQPPALSDPRNRNHKSLAIGNHNSQLRNRKLSLQKSQ